MEFGHRQPRTVIDGHDGCSREELIPGLPHDIAVECFLLLPHTDYPSACCVSKSWRSLLRSRHFYALRRSLHRTRSLACLVQQSPPSANSTDRNGAKPAVGTDHLSQPRYSISVFDPGSLSWTRVPPIPDFPDGLPLFCQLVSTDGKLLVLGGWDPVTYDSLRRVYLHDFVAGEWQRCADMPGMRTFFGAAGADDGRVFVAGGHNDCKNALGSAWVYDVEQNVWEEMEEMSQERDECEGVFVGTEFWVVSGYKTERQGGFEGSADVYEIGERGRPRSRRRVEGVWQEGKCPRGAVCSMNRSEAGLFFELREVVSGVHAGMCSVSTARKVIVFGSDYQEGKQGLYVEEREGGGELGKFVKVEVPEEFSGFVQSGCCVEV